MLKLQLVIAVDIQMKLTRPELDLTRNVHILFDGLGVFMFSVEEKIFIWCVSKATHALFHESKNGCLLSIIFLCQLSFQYTDLSSCDGFARCVAGAQKLE